jgi:hypothetical protein
MNLFMYFFESKQKGLPYCNFISQKQKSLRRNDRRSTKAEKRTKAKHIPSMNKGLRDVADTIIGSSK